METFRNLFYTPIYVAVAGGFLYREGLDVLFSTLPAGRSSIETLKSGMADIIQTGLSRSFMDLDAGHEDAPLHVAEINQRDGFFLVSRRPTDGWSWRDLEGSTLIPIGFTPVPWMSLRFAMKSQGIDPGKVRLVQGLSAREALERFRMGRADYVHMPNPQAEQLIEDGVGYLAAALGPNLGYICYSSFAVTLRLLETRPQVVQRFVKGFYEAQKWLAASESAAVASMVAPFYPGTSEEVIQRSVQRYKEQETWPQAPLIRKEGYAAIRDVLIDGGLVKGRYPYERLVRPEFALQAMQGA
jgi:NitT/TauT family transport system substrate-binding protein